jgi:hypothetical protein
VYHTEREMTELPFMLRVDCLSVEIRQRKRICVYICMTKEVVATCRRVSSAMVWIEFSLLTGSSMCNKSIEFFTFMSFEQITVIY